MSEYVISSNISKINFEPTTIEEILQNIKMILTTHTFSCPMNRSFAWNHDELDGPINIVKARMTANIAEAIQNYEPRVELINVSFEVDDLNGKLKPIVRVRINGTEI